MADASQMEGPVQIIGVDAVADRLVFDERRLQFVLSAVPRDAKVAVVSVVGAFRTGKSFLLDLFLRYLRAGAPAGEGDDAWLLAGGEHLEGNVDAGSPDYVAAGEAGGGGGGGGGGDGAPPAQRAYTGFKWRAGNDRQTLGMWLWNRPFMLPLPSGERVAVLLMDTQGLFDTLTNQNLTAQIFGLSTLISSYQVYNVKERVGEDVLGSVATFSAYARAATEHTKEAVAADAAPAGGAGSGGSRASLGARGSSVEPAGRGQQQQAPPPPLGARELRTPATLGAASAQAPVFQRLEFLVRDFTGVATPAVWGDAARAEAAMGAYFEGLFSCEGERAGPQQRELRDTRSQILSCYANVSYYCLPSPGEVVAGQGDKAFTGRIEDIRERFRSSVARYARIVFTQQLEAKRLFLGDGEAVTVGAFAEFVRECALVFENSAGRLPEMPMLLRATANANTRGAKEKALLYLREVLRVYHERAAHVPPAELQEALAAAHGRALELFDRKATFGHAGTESASHGDKLAVRAALVEELLAMAEHVRALNRARDTKPAEWALLLLLWVALTVLGTALDYTCAPFLSLCASASSAAGLLRTLLLLLIPYALYFGRIPELASRLLGELVALARAHGEALPPVLRDFFNGQPLAASSGGGGVGGGAGVAAGMVAAALQAASAAGGGGGGGGERERAAAAAPAPPPASDELASASPSYTGGALRRKKTRE